MSELTKPQMSASRRGFLFLSVSVLSLLSGATGVAYASPPLWIELDVQSENMLIPGGRFALPVSSTFQSVLSQGLGGGLNLSHGYAQAGKVSFQPENSAWSFSANVRYGRARGKFGVHRSQPIDETSFVSYHTTIPTYPFPYHKTRTLPAKIGADSINADASTSESHLLLDFEAGHDVGIGLLGHENKSTIGMGVRIAQFNASLNANNLQGNTDVHFESSQQVVPTNAFFPSGTRTVPWFKTWTRQRWDSFGGVSRSYHNFVGLGPSLYWDNSEPLWGATQDSGFSLDWGLNAALLFGKQKDKVQHQTTSILACYGQHCPGATPARDTTAITITHSTTVPNVGGFAGVSYRWGDFKGTAGYRADFFFGALHSDLNGEKPVTLGFTGPYASISIGIGD
jgi:hypothetical protein